jgi:hypothetical protein
MAASHINRFAEECERPSGGEYAEREYGPVAEDFLRFLTRRRFIGPRLDGFKKAVSCPPIFKLKEKLHPYAFFRHPFSKL